ncbi:IclR family transcriptional regulator [Pseudochrobactrum sp. sp1633]|uniref:IclR family transcriptional regulator n=1 Tax=Pseudochrobactrum sp. sp1633 TaxID=3036706 RepID=UPI0025A5D938|nr:IclR family transcriptional regulator [Pseudochrobactrum sp. sp1633]MDM8347162.1 IclR family transcriptional regulator [Pseudochrobactrum sp. sp1633]
MSVEAVEKLTQSDRQVPLERYFRLLEFLACYPRGLALSELVTMMMLTKGTVHRLLTAMQRSDLVTVGNGTRPRYLLSARVQRLGRLAVDSDVVATLAKPLLQDLSEKLGETCYLCRLDGTSIGSIAVSSPNDTWTGYVLPGKILQPHATAAGKAIMAFQPPEIIDAAIGAGLPAISDRTITEPKALLKEYATVRENGYATCIQEVVPELSAFAVPIHVEGIGVRYSVGILGPHSRIIHVIEQQLPRAIEGLAKAITLIIAAQRSQAE